MAIGPILGHVVWRLAKMTLNETSTRKQSKRTIDTKEDKDESNSENSDFDESMQDEEKQSFKKIDTNRCFNEDDKQEAKQVSDYNTNHE